jgi:hypothetical protein
MLTLHVRVGFNVVYQYPGTSRTTTIALPTEVSFAYSLRCRNTVVEVADSASVTISPASRQVCKVEQLHSL